MRRLEAFARLLEASKMMCVLRSISAIEAWFAKPMLYTALHRNGEMSKRVNCVKIRHDDLVL